MILVSPEKVLSVLHKRNNARKEDERDKVGYASAVSFMIHATQDDLDELKSESGLVHVGQLRPFQVLYTPAGMIAGERIGENHDHVGLKVALHCVSIKNGDLGGINTLRSMQMEAKERGVANPGLEALLSEIDAMQAKLKEEAAKAAAPAEPADVNGAS